MRNQGFGKTIAYAGRNVIDSVFGDGKYATKRTHKARWNGIAAFLRTDCGVRDLGAVTMDHRRTHALDLSSRIAAGALSVVYAQNALSTFNLVMHGFRRDDALWLSPRRQVGSRTQVRRTPPRGMDRRAVNAAATALAHRGHPAFAAFVILARETGMRRQELLSQNWVRVRDALRCTGRLRIVEGSKGGTAKHVLREVPVPPRIIPLIERLAAMQGAHRSLIPPSLRRVQYATCFAREWRRVRERFGLGRFHDLRACCACDWFHAATGVPAPVFRAGRADRAREREVRATIARRLGHGRRTVTSAYLGSAR